MAAPVEVPATDAYAFEAPSADRDIGADTARNHTDEAVASPEALASAEAPAGEASTTEAPAPEPKADEPPRPKRSGWWQRAKASITGE